MLATLDPSTSDIIGQWPALLPPLLSIALAILTREVHLSLFAGLWLGFALLAGDPFAGLGDALDSLIAVLADAGDAKVVVFSALVGALIALTQHNGGVQGLIDWLSRRSLVTTRTHALTLSFLIGVLVFVESSVTSLVNGSVCRPIFDRMKISREKLAFMCDATAAPICILIPLNAWGAYVNNLLVKEGVDAPLEVFIASIPLNLYALTTIAFVLFVTIIKQRDYGPMRRAEERTLTTGALFNEGSTPLVDPTLTSLEAPPDKPRRAMNFVLPIATMALMMPVGLYITGKGDMLEGSGSTSVFWAVLAGTALAAILALSQRILTWRQTHTTFWKGVGGLVPLAALMILAFALGALAKKLGTGAFVANALATDVPAVLVPAIIFIIGAFIAFATGTSWGTFALLLPLALPLADATGTPLPLALAAVLSGGVFGDHASPISDTTLVASMAAGTDHIDHVKTQLPYALACAAIALVGFIALAAAMAP
jgi:Na+/H+ antiporter NhaC